MILLKRMIVYMKQMINVKLNEINLQVFMLDQAAGTAQLQVQYFELLLYQNNIMNYYFVKNILNYFHVDKMYLNLSILTKDDCQRNSSSIF